MRDLPEDVRHSILYGHDFKVNVSYRNRWGRLREYSTGFEGVVRTLMRRYHETDSDQMKQYYESYMREVPCQACNGRRLRPEVLAVTVDGESIADVCDMPVERGLAWINGLKLEGAAATIAGEVVKEIRARLGFLNDVGLNYLTLSRAAKTLSGGEAQRISLPRRSAPDWSASCTCSTSHRSDCTSVTTRVSSRRCTICATSATR